MKQKMKMKKKKEIMKEKKKRKMKIGLIKRGKNMKIICAKKYLKK